MYCFPWYVFVIWDNVSPDTIGFLLFNFRGCKINVFNMFWCRSLDQTSFCWVGLKERKRFFSYCKNLCYFSLSFPKYDSSNAFLLLRLPRNSSEFSWLLRKLIFFVHFFLGHHSFSTHTKFHEKLILLNSWYAHVQVRIRGKRLVFRMILRAC